MALWGVARTSSCHLKYKKIIGSGKNWFLPFEKRSQEELNHDVMGSGKNRFLPLSSLICGKNRFLPFEKRSQEGLNHDVMGSGKNQFLPLEV